MRPRPRPRPRPCCWSRTRSRTHAAARRCFLGPHRKYDPFTSNFMSLVPGQGQCAAALKPDARLPSACARTHSPRAHRSFAQLRPRRHPRRCALATRRERVAQDGARLDGVARARAARADGLLGALSALPRKRTPPGPRARPPPSSPPPERRHPSSCIRVRVCVCVSSARRAPSSKKSFWRRYQVNNPPS